MKSTKTTEFGKFLRKLRIDCNETGCLMAKKLGVTSSYLSAVELGKRPIPDNWKDNLIHLYFLNDKEIQELNMAIICSSKIFTVDVCNLTNDEKLKVRDLLNKINCYNNIKHKYMGR